jgi:hypothetical protein
MLEHKKNHTNAAIRHRQNLIATLEDD